MVLVVFSKCSVYQDITCTRVRVLITRLARVLKTRVRLARMPNHESEWNNLLRVGGFSLLTVRRMLSFLLLSLIKHVFIKTCQSTHTRHTTRFWLFDDFVNTVYDMSCLDQQLVK